jgi:hypothetical protein
MLATGLAVDYLSPMKAEKRFVRPHLKLNAEKVASLRK